VTGFLVPPRDPMAFAAAIAGLVLNAPLRHRMSAEARLAAVARDIEPENDALFEQYRAVLGRTAEPDEWRAAL